VGRDLPAVTDRAVAGLALTKSPRPRRTEHDQIHFRSRTPVSHQTRGEVRKRRVVFVVGMVATTFITMGGLANSAFAEKASEVDVV
jgi:hypothetical protein